jgi:hypothetical protein
MVALIVIPDVVEGKSSLQIFKKLGMCLLPAILIYMVANSVWGIDIGKKPKDGGKPAVRTVTNIQQPINSATQTITGKVLNIELKPGEVYDVDNIRGEQQWRFLAFNGAFDHRVDKGDGRACWKQVTNTKPWKADWNGKLQLRAGNTPVTITVNVL